MGRPRKPDEVKRLMGNPGGRPLDDPETVPHGRRGIPPVPGWLSGKAVEMWAELAPTLDEMGVLEHQDATALALLASALAEHVEADALVQLEGMTYEDTKEGGGIMLRQNPAVGIRSDAWRRVSLMLSHFGLTPSDRSKVKIAPIAKKDPVDELFQKRQRRRAGA